MKTKLITLLALTLIGCSKEPTTTWVGHPMISSTDTNGATHDWLRSVVVGIRSDGVVVWTNSAAGVK